MIGRYARDLTRVSAAVLADPEAANKSGDHAVAVLPDPIAGAFVFAPLDSAPAPVEPVPVTL